MPYGAVGTPAEPQCTADKPFSGIRVSVLAYPAGLVIYGDTLKGALTAVNCTLASCDLVRMGYTISCFLDRLQAAGPDPPNTAPIGAS